MTFQLFALWQRDRILHALLLFASKCHLISARYAHHTQVIFSAATTHICDKDFCPSSEFKKLESNELMLQVPGAVQKHVVLTTKCLWAVILKNYPI